MDTFRSGYQALDAALGWTIYSSVDDLEGTVSIGASA